MEVVEFVDPARRRGSRDDHRRNRKLFMSSKATDVLKEAPSSKRPPTQDGNEEFFLRDFDLSSIFRGVERIVGNSHLNWKQKKKLEQERAETLGAKPVKKFKVPIEEAKKIQRKRQREEASKPDLEIPRKKKALKRKNKREKKR
ncbi:uncharacterized protein LOC112347902 [Selaginella moellendorffii]|uniref:uncharacterized protein LOC112347902 n=1 Tax=Selaginella moellendorffii TaxID=88036 RepID=UPI000D1C7E5B|nr:uncharacterized protein LOC112347902 [Selaginella moellendorffii]|eukprot:XP_024535336.1 uncharacterized protein LOC112347902 [Selaginella moellendorffii]